MRKLLIALLPVLLLSGCSKQEPVNKGKAMNVHNQINYAEFPAKDMAATKAFFGEVFGWSFTDYGPDYMDVHDVGITVGFYTSHLVANYEKTGSIIVFFSKYLEATQAKIQKAGGTITRPIFAFPGGRRFHFTDPSGNEFGVWSDS